jgi:Met-10+ like-protein
MPNFKDTVKRGMFKLAPTAATSFFAARARAHSHRYLESVGAAALNRRLRDRLGNHVLSGPFAGMQLPEGAWSEPAGPILLGTMEALLHPWIDRVIEYAPTLVIDVGSKVGYYAVGFARRLPHAEVVAFDADPWAMKATAEAARLNGVSITVRGACNPAKLRKLSRPQAFVLSDCEGYEAELFRDPTPYQDMILLIETHDNMVPGVESQLLNAFKSTHDVERAVCDGKSDVSPVDLEWLGDEAPKALSEHRGPQAWLFFTPKAG